MKRESPQLIATDFDAMTGLEASPFQPLTSNPNLWRDLPEPEFARGFDLQCASVHFTLSFWPALF
jgi:hypothetical protein